MGKTEKQPKKPSRPSCKERRSKRSPPERNKNIPNSKIKPTGERGRKKADSTEIPLGVKAILAEMMPYIQKGYPESTVVNRIGLDVKQWENYCARYPALRLEIKKVQAERYMIWQDDLEQGGQGWQAKAVLLERRNANEWSRNQVGRPSNAASPYQSAIKRQRPKK